MEPLKHPKPRLSAWTLLLTTLTLLFATACYPAYSPPVRTGHYGAPPAPKPGQLEVGGAFYANGPIGGGGSLDYAVSDLVQLEAGVDALHETLVMGFLGVRYAPLNRLFADQRFKLTLDLEAGGGVGVGGEHCSFEEQDEPGWEDDCDGLEWQERVASGGYFGLGVGFNVGIFDLFARGRLQLTEAQSAPMTLWSTALIGTQWIVAKRVKFYLGGGVARYDNQEDSIWGGLAETGLSLLFDTKPAQPHPPTTP